MGEVVLREEPSQPRSPGEFDIPNVPAGDYMLSVWDFDQNNILYSQNVTVRPGEQTDMDTLRLAQWWTWIHGTVFDDTNSNGKQDPGEKGIPHQVLTVRERSNSLYKHGSNLTTTDENGHYELRARLSARPVARARAVLRRLQDHRPHLAGGAGEAATTKLGEAVDVNFLPVDRPGRHHRLGQEAYKADENGGIVGVVSYGTTRNELDPGRGRHRGLAAGHPRPDDAHLQAPSATRTATSSTTPTARSSSRARPLTARVRPPTSARPTPPRRGIAPSTARASTPTATASPIRSWPTTPCSPGPAAVGGRPPRVRGGHRRRHEDRPDRRPARTPTGARP